MKKGFDNEKYVNVQSEEIIKKINGFERLYLEFGGKLYGDFHAARVLLGYDPDTKINILNKIKDKCEMIFCISAKDIENSKIRGDLGMNYVSSALKSINDLKKRGFLISAIVINRFSGEKKAVKFIQYLDNLGIRNYTQKEIEGYPADIDKIVSTEGYGQNPYVPLEKPIIVVAGVGPGSGKMSFCLSQMYFDSLKNIKSGFAKFETFPVWNLSVDHPINIAYEAATLDIGDKIMIDPFYLKETKMMATSYNRDIENFPILKKIFEKIDGVAYKSPTEMGVNKIKEGIVSENNVIDSANQEIIRRYFRYKKEYQMGIVSKDILDNITKVMKSQDLDETNRAVVVRAREYVTLFRERNPNSFKGASIQLDNSFIFGKNTSVLSSESSCILNALKHLARIPDEIDLLSTQLIDSVSALKSSLEKEDSNPLSVSDILIILAISAHTNPSAKICIDKIPLLSGAEMHTTHLPEKEDELGIRKLGIHLTTDGEISDKIPLID